MNTTATLFDAGGLIKRPRRRSASVDVKVGDDKVTGVGGVVLWGPMLDRLNLVGVADERQLRPIGPGGYTGGGVLPGTGRDLDGWRGRLVGPIAA